jgi:hypothetical protein
MRVSFARKGGFQNRAQILPALVVNLESLQTLSELQAAVRARQGSFPAALRQLIVQHALSGRIMKTEMQLRARLVIRVLLETPPTQHIATRVLKVNTKMRTGKQTANNVKWVRTKTGRGNIHARSVLRGNTMPSKVRRSLAQSVLLEKRKHYLGRRSAMIAASL